MRSLASEAIVFAVLTILLYLYAYAFEAGFALQFQYPPELIGLTLSSLAGPWILMLFVYLFGFLQLNFQYWPYENRWKIRFLFVLVGYVAITLWLMAISPRWTVAIVGTISAVIAVVANSIYARSVRLAGVTSNATPRTDANHMSPELKDVSTVYDRKSSIPRYSIAYALTVKFGQDPMVYFLMLLIVLPAICAFAGATQAAGQKDFYLIESVDHLAQTELVIRIVDGTIISVPYDRASETYVRQFHVQQSSALEEKRLVPLRIDNLKPTN